MTATLVVPTMLAALNDEQLARPERLIAAAYDAANSPRTVSIGERRGGL